MQKPSRFQNVESLLRQINIREALTEISREACERSLLEFVEQAWPYLAPESEFRSNWHLEAICEHLQAVNAGTIKRLLINCPPRFLKSVIVSVCWPMWTWARRQRGLMNGPAVKFLCASYNQDLSWDLSTASRRLMVSPFYQERWGKRFQLTGDQNTKSRFDNTAGGSRIATSVGGSLLGLGGNILILDDPHNVNEVLSESEMIGAQNWYKEFSTTRFNDPSTGALVVIMQRLAQGDISGFILEKDAERQWTYLKMPMEFDPAYPQVPTILGWVDPRALDEDGDLYDEEDMQAQTGELLHPERVPREQVEEIKLGLGPYLASGRLQQDPVPEGGAIIREEFWQLWRPEAYPNMGTIVASLDGAFTEREENDFSALTVWGAFLDDNGKPALMLMDAWQKRLPINGLVQTTADTCKKHRVDTLLIEAKASGISTAQEIQRLYGRREWQTVLVNPKGDKVARVKAVEPLFAAKLIYAPNRDFADMVIDQCKIFPKGSHDDLVDSTSQALRWMRTNGVAVTRQEHDADEIERRRYRRPALPVYDA